MWWNAAVIAGLVGIVSAETYEFFRWNTPGANLAANNIYRRQLSPPGYSPEFGSCGTGRTCEDACGPNWESCQASTSLSLFCYNRVDLNQTCCENGSGRACDSGYYCAWEQFEGRVWCCEDGQSLEECGVPHATTATSSPTRASSTSSPTSSSSSSGSATHTGSSQTVTGGETLSTTTASQCPASTVTSWATTTVISTVGVPAPTVTVTVTMPGPGCAPSTSLSSSFPPSSTSWPGTVTDPPFPTSAAYTPPIYYNSTTTSFIVTAGSGRLVVNSLGLVVLLLQLLWI
ncbi:hypothetical protein MYCTH_2305568 [Thermothelomyces thermophilus ATCC 42464]|uniref:Uncharacterized protein n=1 Tax=Thermothelomyces thermophilus (strain ATCC 42464 / BCRC 31852 / DSM 1799) TaxID=573729 RepID=G2QDE4_THET4|nr:uncharacterized protein MYCTH_2305568 [Thermothelomyces thermophilus ATCC 42464]AEO58309.1 hypothetical protein MYCTH_2305568 [Thermothelomyces thermophilus ATCC 42464]